MKTHKNIIISKRYIKWEDNFELLKIFKQEFNRFPRYKESYKGG